MSEELAGKLRTLCSTGIQDARRRGELSQDECSWFWKPPHGAIVVMSLCHWRDQIHEMQSYLEKMAQAFKIASGGKVVFPYVVACTHRDVFLRDWQKEDPANELKKVEDEIKKAALTEHVYSITSYKKDGLGSARNNKATFDLLSQLTKAKLQNTAKIDRNALYTTTGIGLAVLLVAWWWSDDIIDRYYDLRDWLWWRLCGYARATLWEMVRRRSNALVVRALGNSSMAGKELVVRLLQSNPNLEFVWSYDMLWYHMYILCMVDHHRETNKSGCLFGWKLWACSMCMWYVHVMWLEERFGRKGLDIALSDPLMQRFSTVEHWLHFLLVWRLNYMVWRVILALTWKCLFSAGSTNAGSISWALCFVALCWWIVTELGQHLRQSLGLVDRLCVVFAGLYVYPCHWNHWCQCVLRPCLFFRTLLALADQSVKTYEENHGKKVTGASPCRIWFPSTAGSRVLLMSETQRDRPTPPAPCSLD